MKDHNKYFSMTIFNEVFFLNKNIWILVTVTLSDEKIH